VFIGPVTIINNISIRLTAYGHLHNFTTVIISQDFSKHVASFKEEDPAMAVLYCLEKCYEKGSLALLWFSALSAVGDFAAECSVCERAECEKGGFEESYGWVEWGFGLSFGQ